MGIGIIALTIVMWRSRTKARSDFDRVNDPLTLGIGIAGGLLFFVLGLVGLIRSL